MERLGLIPPLHRAERLFLLDVLGEEGKELRFGECDVEAFLAVTPEKLYPLVYARIKDRAERLGIPSSLLEVLALHYRRNLLLELRRSADLKRLDATLSEAGIPYLVLKGPVLAAAVYPDPASRTMTDLDLLVSGADLQRAIESLERIGYRVPPQFVGASLAAGDVPPLMRDEPGGLPLELHWMLDSLPEQRNALEQMLPSARLVPVGHGLMLPALERGEFFAHVVVHVSKHHRFEGELRSLLDVALLLGSDAEALDWKSLDAVWQRRGIGEWIVLTVTLAHVLLGSPMPALYRERRPPDEALTIAAEQLWIARSAETPMTITYALAGRQPTPVHSRVSPERTAAGSGVAGARVRAARFGHRALRVLTAMRHGRLRPSVIRSEVDLFLKRERLFALIESAKRSEPEE